MAPSVNTLGEATKSFQIIFHQVIVLNLHLQEGPENFSHRALQEGTRTSTRQREAKVSYVDCTVVTLVHFQPPFRYFLVRTAGATRALINDFMTKATIAPDYSFANLWVR